jgi:hypothetical protein
VANGALSHIFHLISAQNLESVYNKLHFNLNIRLSEKQLRKKVIGVIVPDLGCSNPDRTQYFGEAATEMAAGKCYAARKKTIVKV